MRHLCFLFALATALAAVPVSARAQCQASGSVLALVSPGELVPGQQVTISVEVQSTSSTSTPPFDPVATLLLGSITVELACLDAACATPLPGVLEFESCTPGLGIASCAPTSNPNQILINPTIDGVELSPDRTRLVATIRASAAFPPEAGSFFVRAQTTSRAIVTNDPRCLPQAQGSAGGSTFVSFPNDLQACQASVALAPSASPSLLLPGDAVSIQIDATNTSTTFLGNVPVDARLVGTTTASLACLDPSCANPLVGTLAFDSCTPGPGVAGCAPGADPNEVEVVMPAEGLLLPAGASSPLVTIEATAVTPVVAPGDFFTVANTGAGAVEIGPPLCLPVSGSGIGSAPLTFSPDIDGDGIETAIDLEPEVFSNDFSDASLGGASDGTIIDRGDQTIQVRVDTVDALAFETDEGGGPQPAIVEVCGGVSLLAFPSGSLGTYTCGSVSLTTLRGSVRATFELNGQPAAIEVGAGNSVLIDPAAGRATAAPDDPDLLVIETPDRDAILEPGEALFLAAEIQVKGIRTIAFKHREWVVPRSPNARIWVALLGSDQLDVETVQTDTLAFGPGGAPPERVRTRDTNRDGHPDLHLRFRAGRTGITGSDVEACLGGEFAVDDETISFVACDDIRTP